MITGTGAWLREQRESRGWPRREMARRLTQAGQAAGDTLPSINHLCTYIRRWEHGHGLTERYKVHYCTAFGISARLFGTTVANPGPGGTATVDLRLLATSAVAYRGSSASSSGGFAVGQEVLMTAHESSDHAEQAGQPGLGETTVEQLRADIARLARESATGEPFAVFLDMRRVRDRIYRLLDRRLLPREQTDLYFLLGCLSGLMGIAANWLGYPDSAEELNRAGWAYASAIDHRPLMAWLRGERSACAFFRGRITESSNLAQSGLQYLSVGRGGALLHLHHARAAGRLGDADTARRAISEAHEARDRDYNDELLEMGGEYDISKAFHHGQAGAALASVIGAEHDAEEELGQAISLYREGPGEGEDHWFAGMAVAGIDLAMVRLRSGALDAATSALEPALLLPPTQRISAVTIRLAAVRDELAAPIFRGSAQARRLGERIEDFGRATIVADLHSLPGSSG